MFMKVDDLLVKVEEWRGENAGGFAAGVMGGGPFSHADARAPGAAGA